MLEYIEYRGWKNCFRLSNPSVDLVGTLDVGPRLIRFGFIDAPNVFGELTFSQDNLGRDEWQRYGGHRLWHAPEVMPRTYAPDNSSVRLEPSNQGVRLIQNIERTTGIGKEIRVELDPQIARATVVHCLRNNNLWSIELAPWAISMMAAGGTAILPLARTPNEQLIPVTSVALWSYTDMTDPRWYWGREYILLHQNPQRPNPQKTGVCAAPGWIAYVWRGYLFVKLITPCPNAGYPDFGCSIEAYTDVESSEIETFGPLVRLEPGACVIHTEHWFLFKDIPSLQNDEDVSRYVLPQVKVAEEILGRLSSESQIG